MIRFVVMKDYLTILAFIFFFATPKIHCQEDYTLKPEELSEHKVSVAMHQGFLLAHYDFMDYYLKKNTQAFKFSIEKQLKRGWTSSYGYISRGLEVYRTSLSNNELLGHALHFVCYTDLAIHANTRGRLKVGAGLGILTQKFDLDKNYKNIAIGTTANAAIVFEYSYAIPFLKEYSLTPAVRFTHYSNGAFKLPNLGLNLASAGISIEKKLVNESIQAFEPEAHTILNRLTIGASIGRNEYKSRNSGQFFNSNLNVQYVNLELKKMILGAGLDFHYSEAMREYYKNTSSDAADAGTLKTALRTGAHIVTGLKLGSSEIHLNTGFYVYDFLNEKGKIYQRIYFLQHLGSSWQIRMGLKAHLTAAETLEFGINKTLWKN